MGELLRFGRLRNHIEEFIAYDLGYILQDLKDYGIITGFSYVCRLAEDFKKGIDFYIVLENKEIGIQLTDNRDVVDSFSKQGVATIFLPEKNAKGELLFPEEKRKIFKKRMQKILSDASRIN